MRLSEQEQLKGKVVKNRYKFCCWLFEMFPYKMYFFIGAIVICSVAHHGACSLDPDPVHRSDGIIWLRDAIFAGVATWFSLTLILRVVRNSRLDRELCSDPFEWSKGATAGTTTFVLMSICLVAPLLRRPYPFTILTVAVAELIAVMGGITVYLENYWQGRQNKERRCIESLKAEHLFWNTLFSCSTVWVGAFVGGVLLSVCIGGNMITLKDKYPAIPEDVLGKVILYHSMAAFYVAIGDILWMLRPIHRRLEQISMTMDRLANKRDRE
jgi:hypothetical protein